MMETLPEHAGAYCGYYSFSCETEEYICMASDAHTALADSQKLHVELPEDWEAVTDDHGRIYYWNVSTDEVSCVCHDPLPATFH